MGVPDLLGGSSSGWLKVAKHEVQMSASSEHELELSRAMLG